MHPANERGAELGSRRAEETTIRHITTTRPAQSTYTDPSAGRSELARRAVWRWQLDLLRVVDELRQVRSNRRTAQ